MAYTTLPDAAIDQDSLATEDVFFALRDNPLEMFSGGANAPRLARNVSRGFISTGSNLTFTGLAGWNGLIAQGFVQETASGSVIVSISQDGTTYGTTTQIAGASGPFVFELEFATGAYSLVSGTARSGWTLPGANTGTLNNFAAALSSIRFTTAGTTRLAVFMELTGGRAAS